ncbi:MAG: hypothetical protein ACNA7Q_10230 [Rhodobacterales bacterium]
MYFDKFSAAQSTGMGVDFCELNESDFTPELVAQIRSNPNYDNNLAAWLRECPELALAFADFGTATIASPAAPGFMGGEASPGEGGGGIIGGGGTGNDGNNGGGDDNGGGNGDGNDGGKGDGNGNGAGDGNGGGKGDGNGNGAGDGKGDGNGNGGGTGGSSGDDK